MSAAQQIEAASNPHALLRMATVEALTGLSRSSIYAKIKNGSLPLNPIRQGVRCTRFKAGEVTAWLQSLHAAEGAR